ncbi:alpha/beta hydrolase [Lutibacter sp. A64]|uniref:alpha/beta hydrolase family protein n=1 Tax=Lutibacter sp. A64 TaxID=2918526 RepID=UPI001F06C655|nr:alpha/beta hydrolase [Lutibacter sp. A64]UMB55324.1 alpha/beta hydrolase [Lutibacter sp. A64]
MTYKITTFLIFFISVLTVAQEKNYTELEVSIPTNSVTINGTLLTPNTSEKKPLVIIIPGSGPTDRDGNNAMMKNNSLKFLAEALTAKSIATYRYDKSALSYTKEEIEKIDTLTFDTFIYEAKRVIDYFKNTEMYSKIIVAGHSQGSLVGMIASQNKVDGFISIEGAGRSIDEVLVEQIELQAPFLKDETQKIVIELKKGNTVDKFNPMLISLFNKQIQPFLMSWMQYNPQEEIAKLAIPILIINGSKDIQVKIVDAELLHKAAPKSELFIVENMNHIFKEIKGDLNENMQSYNDSKLPIMLNFSDKISTFAKDLK